ncbi:MAG: DUF664 domain-containing protein [Nocardioides sp.]
MSEHQRVGRDPGEPDPDGPDGHGRWADYLDWVREELIEGVLTLAPNAQRRPLVPSGWTALELLSHVLHMEQRWFLWGFLGEPVAEPWGDWDVEEPWETTGGRWRVADDVTAEELVARLRELGRRTSEVLATHPPESRASSRGRFAEDPPTLEWICFHVLAEYARHAGHLDIALELSTRN